MSVIDRRTGSETVGPDHSTLSTFNSNYLHVLDAGTKPLKPRILTSGSTSSAVGVSGTELVCTLRCTLDSRGAKMPGSVFEMLPLAVTRSKAPPKTPRGPASHGDMCVGHRSVIYTPGSARAIWIWSRLYAPPTEGRAAF